MSRKNRFAVALAGAAILALSVLAVGASSKPSVTTAKAAGITLGFSQVGAESGWRTANTKSIQESAKAAGIDLKFSDAQQKQENQIKAIRSYIQQKVDVIAFSPVVESGWDTVLKEAKGANIPVILTDRAVDSKDTDALQDLPRLRLRQGGQQGGRVAASTSTRTRKGPVNIVELAGHDRLGAGDRPQEGLRGRDQGEPEAQDHRVADR